MSIVRDFLVNRIYAKSHPLGEIPAGGFDLMSLGGLIFFASD
jgi:hypothetical protein